MKTNRNPQSMHRKTLFIHHLAEKQPFLRDDEDFKLIALHYPHISMKIAVLWGSETLQTYLRDLFLDTRDGARQGFPKEISQALFRLSTRSSSLASPRGEKDSGGWDNVVS